MIFHRKSTAKEKAWSFLNGLMGVSIAIPAADSADPVPDVDAPPAEVFLFGFGVPWFLFGWFVWRLSWFWTSALHDSAWWGLLAILLTSIALAPIASGALLVISRTLELSEKRIEMLFGALFMAPGAMIWGALWLVCLPIVWGLWPYDSFWKIFPALGLLFWGGAPSFGLLGMIFWPLPAEPIELGSRYLERSMKGSDVREMQALLNDNGASIGVDGRFGSQTEGAVKQFQSDAGLEVDGIVGPETLAALLDGSEVEQPEAQLDPDGLKPAFGLSTDMVEIYNDRASGGARDVSIWRTSTGLSLGDHVKEGYGSPSRPILVGTEVGERQQMFSRPEGFDLAWIQERGHQSLWVWLPRPPTGFVALGILCTTTGVAPSIDLMRCVSEDTVSETEVGALIWNDAGTGGPDGSFWSLPHGLAMISPGSHAEPTSTVYAADVERTVETDGEEAVPDEAEPVEAEPDGTPDSESVAAGDSTDEAGEPSETVDTAAIEPVSPAGAADEPETTTDMASLVRDIDSAGFGSDRDARIEAIHGSRHDLEMTIDRIERTGGFGVSEELHGGRTVIGRTPDGVEVQLRLPESRNDEILALGSGDTLRGGTRVSGWNAIRKQLILDSDD